MARVAKRFQCVVRAEDGSVAITAAIVMPVLVLAVGGFFDFAALVQQKARLQDMIDTAALAAAKEMSLADFSRDNVSVLVTESVRGLVAANRSGMQMPRLESFTSNEPIEVKVVAKEDVKSVFGVTIDLLPKEIVVEATARIIGRPNICVIALDPAANGVLSLEKNARVTGNNCAVFSNSTHTNGLSSKDSASLTANSICTAGGKDGGPGNFSPTPLTDCPQFDDPLSRRLEPTAVTCSSYATLVVNTSRRLSPGTYCGGIRIEALAQVTLDPGTYSISGGPLVVQDGAGLIGESVGFYLTGSGATLTFNRGSSISLTAGKQGSMAGLLVFEGRNQPTSAVHQILSDDARQLLGTLYFPRGRLHVDANAPIADKSAYTAIVARMLTLHGGPHLILNSRYEITDVPVPEGIKGVGQPAHIVR